jgi:hypothetical protein
MSTATDATPSPDESSAGLGAGHNQWDVLIVLIVVAGLVALTFLVVEIAPADAANILGVVAPVLAAVFGISIGAYAGKAVGKQQGRQQGKQEVKSQLQEPLQQLQAKTRTSADILRTSAESPAGSPEWLLPSGLTVPPETMQIGDDVDRLVGFVNGL